MDWIGMLRRLPKAKLNGRALIALEDAEFLINQILKEYQNNTKENEKDNDKSRLCESPTREAKDLGAWLNGKDFRPSQ